MVFILRIRLVSAIWIDRLEWHNFMISNHNSKIIWDFLAKFQLLSYNSVYLWKIPFTIDLGCIFGTPLPLLNFIKSWYCQLLLFNSAFNLGESSHTDCLAGGWGQVPGRNPAQAKHQEPEAQACRQTRCQASSQVHILPKLKHWNDISKP